MSTTTLPERFAATLARLGLAPDVLVGVSGGADSVALLHLLVRAGLTPVVGHLDHGSRPDSGSDAAWVATLAADLGLASEIGTAAIAWGAGYEERARDARHAFLLAAARRVGVGAIALGHHRDDQAETVLFRMVRGTGPDGLAGIPLDRPFGEGLRLVRPLLNEPAAEIRAWLNAQGLAWREDPTNQDLGPARNRLRHEVLPILTAMQPGASAHLARLSQIFREESVAGQELLGPIANLIMVVVAPGIGELDREAFNGSPIGDRRRLLRLLAARMQASPPSFEGIERALAVAEAGGGADLGSGWRIDADPRWLALRRQAIGPAPAPLVPDGPQPTSPWGWTVTARTGSSTGRPGPCLVRLDPDKAPPDLVWRTAEPDGDRFQPWDHDRRSTLRRWLTRQGVPGHRQESLLVLAAGPEIYWVVGYGRGALLASDVDPSGCWEMQAAARFRV